MDVSGWLGSLKRGMRRERKQTVGRRSGRSGRRPEAGDVAARTECLEDRTLLSVTSVFFAFSNELIVGATADDAIQLRVVAGNVLVNNQNPSTGPLPAASVESIHIQGSSGKNNIDLSQVRTIDFPNLTSVIVEAGQGADTIIGSEFNDSLLGGHGDDVIHGGLGNDTIDAGDGNDLINATADTIQTIAGSDTVIGGQLVMAGDTITSVVFTPTLGEGDDSILGDDGNDTIFAGDGNDFVDAGDGEDSVNGDAGDDNIVAGDGGDTVHGGLGADTINGGFGRDLVHGNEDDDTVFGGADQDTLLGDAGNDKLNGQGGADSISGGVGNDSLLGGMHDDIIFGGDGEDIISGGDAGDTLVGGDGNDQIDGEDGDDSILGGNGNDTLEGGGGHDTLNGNAGDDCVRGQSGNDTLFGGGGADILDGGTGDDVVDSAGPDVTGLVTISIDDVTTDPEGDGSSTDAVFTISLSGPATDVVTVNFTSVDDTAVSPDDYGAVNGTLVFQPGQTVQTVTVPVFGDVLSEGDVPETYRIQLSDPLNAVFATDMTTGLPDDSGIGSIIDDDFVFLTINDVTVLEGNTGTVNAVFTLNLVDANDLPAVSEVPVTVDFTTEDDTATEFFDYNRVQGLFTIVPGVSSMTLSVPVFGDLIAEPDETFFVNLSNPFNAQFRTADIVQPLGIVRGTGTIVSEMTDPNIGIQIDDVVVTEGGMATFTVTLSIAPPMGTNVMVTVNTMDGMGPPPLTTPPAAIADPTMTIGDYVPLPVMPPMVLTFMGGAGVTQMPVSVMTFDTVDPLTMMPPLIEPDEEFRVVLSGPMNAVFEMNMATGMLDNTGFGLIVDDDGTFDIATAFGGGLTPAQQQAFARAEMRWEQVILGGATGDVSDFTSPMFGTIDDILVIINSLAIDGPGGELAQTMIVEQRPAGDPDEFLPAVATIVVDAFDLPRLEADGLLDALALREMAHALGFGTTVWTDKGLVASPGGMDPRFTGASARAEYNALFGVMEPGVPLELPGDPASANALWRESVFVNEVMTPVLNAGVRNDEISRVTVGQFQDVGYVVSFNAADPFQPATVPPIVPPPPMPPGPAVPVFFQDLDTGLGDGTVRLRVDGFGSFGSDVGMNSTDAFYDPVDPTGGAGLMPIFEAGTSFESGVLIRINGTGPRQALTSGDIGTSGGLVAPEVVGDNSMAASTFLFNVLSFDLFQTLEPLFDPFTGVQTGSLLTQTYFVTNNSLQSVNFELLRYLDGNLLFDGNALLDSGGRFVQLDGTEVLFETEIGGSGPTDPTFLGITATDGTGGSSIPLSDRFEVGEAVDLLTRALAGDPLNDLDDSVAGDTNGDGLIDNGNEYDVALALRNVFSLAGRATTVYVSTTQWGNGLTATQIAPPAPPTDPIGDTLLGGLGSDTLLGSAGDDLMHGQSGDDVLDGDGGNDTMFGGAGRDSLDGGSGDDFLSGDTGADTVLGGTGNDTIHWEVGEGSESVDGGVGFDLLRLETETQNDRFFVDAVNGGLRVEHRVPSVLPASDILRAVAIEDLQISSDGGADRVQISDLTGVADLQLVTLDLGGGRDFADASGQLSGAVRLAVDAGIGDDTVIGGAGDDTILGDMGHDSLSGGEGNDLLDGGEGVDKLFGEGGDDFLIGGAGRDFLRAGDGDDTVDGGSQNDDIFAGAGADSVFGGADNDLILGEDGDDTLGGGDGSDTIVGADGNDSLLGNAGDDTLDGGDGDDTMFGGLGNDNLAGGDGADSLTGGDGLFVTMRTEPDGDDLLNGNAGNDTLTGEEGDDTLLGGAGDDELDGGVDKDSLNGHAGNDSMRGGDGNDILRGGMHDDSLNGGHGEDTLNGEDGNDGLSGHDGDDRVNGGGGDDTLHGGDGDDTLRGGAGVDILIGHDGADDLDGQGGSFDTLVGGDSFDVLEDNGGTDIIDNAFKLKNAFPNQDFDWIDAA